MTEFPPPLPAKATAARHLSAGCVYLDGVFVPPARAVVSAFDHGYLYGDGLFETLRSYAGAPFRLGEHLARLTDGLTALGFPSVRELPQLADIVLETLARSSLADAYLRITITRGVATEGLDPANCREPTLMVAALPLRAYSDVSYREGVHVTLLWARSRHDRPPPHVKTTSFQRGVLARPIIKERGAFEGLYLDESGRVTEGSVSNVFARYGDKLITPPAAVCLPGITRAEVLAIARSIGLAAAEEDLPVPRLLEADEIFLTSSLAELMPVVRVDDCRIGDGIPGPSQELLRREYLARAMQPRPT